MRLFSRYSKLPRYALTATFPGGFCVLLRRTVEGSMQHGTKRDKKGAKSLESEDQRWLLLSTELHLTR
jgi:hypothetical protein